MTFTSQRPGLTPFIELVQLQMDDSQLLKSVQFTIRPKAGSFTRAISARYSRAYLIKNGFFKTRSGAITVPIFGLYQAYNNAVELVCGFTNGASETQTLTVVTAGFHGGIYNGPTVVQARAANTALSYDFILLKAFSSGYSPIIIDTDGEIRWVGTDNYPSMEAIFFDNSIFVVAHNTTLRRMELNGSFTDVADYAAQGVMNFHHNIDLGKTGLLLDVTTPDYDESVNMEVDTSGKVLHIWNLANIINNAMRAGGDDPTQFVAEPGTQVDWFHNNCAAYRPSDDSIVISSRENFVIALDYETRRIKWILGDPTKQWHQFPSLSKYALTGSAGMTYPVGQHALSFFEDELLLFDNGYNSADHTPKGVNRSYSAPRKYAIDQAAGTVTETWNYLAGESLFSPIGSSVYEDQPNNYLADYATIGPYLDAEIVGLAPGAVKIFDYKFTEINTLTTAWNATVLHLEDLVFN